MKIYDSEINEKWLNGEAYDIIRQHYLQNESIDKLLTLIEFRQEINWGYDTTYISINTIDKNKQKIVIDLLKPVLQVYKNHFENDCEIVLKYIKQQKHDILNKDIKNLTFPKSDILSYLYEKGKIKISKIVLKNSYIFHFTPYIDMYCEFIINTDGKKQNKKEIENKLNNTTIVL